MRYFISEFFSPGFQRRPSFWVTLFIFLILVYAVFHWFEAQPKHQKNLTAVVVAPVQAMDVPVYLSALGNVTPGYSVMVRTQVNGILERLDFQEGQMVKAGDLLAEIDARPLQAQLLQYQGQLARDQALLNNAQLDLQRYQKLWRENSISKQNLDTQTSLVKQYQGTVKLDQGLIANTQVNLSYCKITAPISGRIGLRQVDPGNLVQTSDQNGIAVINSIDPITVIFSLPEDTVSQVMTQLNRGKALRVNAFDRNQTQLLATGVLQTIDNQIDPSTGTFKLKASFANPSHLLFPNQFVNIELLLKIIPHAIVVPTAAILHGTPASYVFVVDPKHHVKLQAVTEGIAFGERTTINKGLLPGQTVVIQGADQLNDGQKVQVVQTPFRPAPANP